jgi:hypothetical protein
MNPMVHSKIKGEVKGFTSGDSLSILCFHQPLLPDRPRFDEGSAAGAGACG